jgi:hypothetical protein
MPRPRTRFLSFLVVGLVISGLRHPVPSWRWVAFGCVWSLAVSFVLYLVMPPAPAPVTSRPPTPD